MEWRLFADLASAAGDRRVTVSVADGATVGDALDALFAARPALRERAAPDGGLRPDLTVLRNGDPVDTDESVAEGDELALLPPVSGG